MLNLTSNFKIILFRSGAYFCSFDCKRVSYTYLSISYVLISLIRVYSRKIGAYILTGPKSKLKHFIKIIYNHKLYRDISQT